ncbi:hypothetical protein BRADI_1g04750v3 [Brachypodium distachyon]|uniref:Secreted protein n=2 Tax=Brachypodium distachyon TaxID=15368 RepID=A0A0Q3GNF7_BRADI|nr:hypothetical protein BRADI_1g04750v3 [Brachypodium distachyon]
MVTSSLTHPFYFLLLLHALQPLFPHFTPPHEAITSGSHQGFLMGWLHSLFSPVRKLLVRAHSARRNRRGMRILYKDVKSCQDEDVHVLWSILVDSHHHPAMVKLKL